MADLADRFDVTVISDEVHGPLVYADSPPFTPYLTVAGGTRGFAVHSAAKTFSLAALKAVVIAGERNGIHLPRVAQGPNASLSGVYAHAAAWDGGDAWLAQLLTELDANRRLVVDQVAATLPGMAVLMPQATYLMWRLSRPRPRPRSGALLPRRGARRAQFRAHVRTARRGARPPEHCHLPRHPHRDPQPDGPGGVPALIT